MPDGVVTDTDIDTTNSVALPRYNVTGSNSFWRTLQSIAGGEKGGEFYSIWFDRKNKFYVQPTPAFWSTPPTTKGTIDSTNIKGTIRVKLLNNRPNAKIGQVTLTSGRDSSTIYTSKWPATTPATGRIHRALNGIWADSQSKSDTLAERLYKWLTRNYTLTVEVDPGLILFGNDGNGLDLADKVTLDYDGPTLDATTGAGLHLDLSDDYFVYGVSVRFDPFGKMAQGFLTLESDPT